MFETISQGFKKARQGLTGVAELTEANIGAALSDVRLSLLEADVEFKTVKVFVDNVRTKALGEEVRLRAKTKDQKQRVKPGDHFVRICEEELVRLMGPTDSDLNFAAKGPTGIMMVGLQGSGKTTSTGKLANRLQSEGKSILMVAADVYRPAAIAQLQTLGGQLGVSVYAEESQDPVGICSRAMDKARADGTDIVLFDTAGRLAIDEALMAELGSIKSAVSPANILLVVDAMMGQDAVKTADMFNKQLSLSGVVLTKLDGDARGGAALSIRAVTGAPIKFLGTGESLDKLEDFRPEGLASRILGMGDVVGLMKDFESVVDAEEAEQDAMEMLKGHFTMESFLKQIKTIQKMGSLSDLFEKMPFFSGGLPDGINLDDKQLVYIEAMINSMTLSERRDPRLFRVGRTTSFVESRLKRISGGSGRSVKEVKELIQKFEGMSQMMKKMGSGLGLMGKIPGLKQVSQLRKLASGGGGDLMEMMQGLGGPGAGMGMPGASPGPKYRPRLSTAQKNKNKAKRKNARKSRRK